MIPAGSLIKIKKVYKANIWHFYVNELMLAIKDVKLFKSSITYFYSFSKSSVIRYNGVNSSRLLLRASWIEIIK
jgi:hypothetical protein